MLFKEGFCRDHVFAAVRRASVPVVFAAAALGYPDIIAPAAFPFQFDDVVRVCGLLRGHSHACVAKHAELGFFVGEQPLCSLPAHSVSLSL